MRRIVVWMLTGISVCGCGEETTGEAATAGAGAGGTGGSGAGGGAPASGVLGAADFEYLGSYPVANQNGLTFGSGLTIRYVDGQLRFLTTSYDTGQPAVLDEFALPDGSDGAATSGDDNPEINTLTR